MKKNNAILLLSKSFQEGFFFFFIATSFYLSIALLSFNPTDPSWSFSGNSQQHHIINYGGAIGAWISDLLISLFGYIAYAFPLLIAYFSWYLVRAKRTHQHWLMLIPKWIGLCLMILTITGLFTLYSDIDESIIPASYGGMLGGIISHFFITYVSEIGTFLVLIIGLLTSFSLLIGYTWSQASEFIGENFIRLFDRETVSQSINRKTEAKSEPFTHPEDAVKITLPLNDDELKPVISADINIDNIDDVEPTNMEDNTAIIEDDDKEKEKAIEAEMIAILAHSESEPLDINAVVDRHHENENLTSQNHSTLKENKKADKEDEKSNNKPPHNSQTYEDNLESSIADFEDQLDNILANQRNDKEIINPEPTETIEKQHEIDEDIDIASLYQEYHQHSNADNASSLIEISEAEQVIMPKQHETSSIQSSTEIKAVPAISTKKNDDSSEQGYSDFLDQRECEPIKSVVCDTEPEPELLNDDEIITSPLPCLTFLDVAKPSQNKPSPEQLNELARKVEQRLNEFNITVEVVDVFLGPVITCMELLPSPGFKVSRLNTIVKDLARSLTTVSVRIVDVIPGKSVIGLELPNDNREMVWLSEIFLSPKFTESTYDIPIALGKAVNGQPSVVDLAKMPHVMVAGTTGSGKSVAINVMILSMLYTHTAKTIRMIMIDPKMLELSIYDGIPHLLTPVVTDMKDASNSLKWCVMEMERRYRLLAAIGVRNLAGFNKKIRLGKENGQPLMDPLYDLESTEPQQALEHLPYIVVIVDELADMMMTVGKKVEELIARLAQKARAAGIHLILATQRPSVDVITGLIKANIPTRMSFQVSSKIDSRTILDQMGAENLLGHGDMLYMSRDSNIPSRVHGAFVDDHEVHKVVNFLKQQGKPEYVTSITEEKADPLVALEGSQGDSNDDVLYEQAVKIVLDTRKASISGVQRRLKIGYNRAARLVEAMEEAGLVSAPMHNGNREILVGNEE